MKVKIEQVYMVKRLAVIDMDVKEGDIMEGKGTLPGLSSSVWQDQWDLMNQKVVAENGEGFFLKSDTAIRMGLDRGQ